MRAQVNINLTFKMTMRCLPSKPPLESSCKFITPLPSNFMVARTTLDLGVYHLSNPLIHNFNEFVWGY